MGENLDAAATESGTVKKSLLSILITLILLIFLLAFSRQWQAVALRNVGYLWLNQATAVTQTEDIHKASKHASISLQAGEKIAADRTPFQYGLGFAAALLGNEEDALALWQPVDDMFAATLTFGKQALAVGDTHAAQTWFERAARLNPQAADPWYYQGLTSLSNNQPADAAAYFDRAVNDGYTFLSTPESEVLCTLGWYYHWQAPERKPIRAEQYYSAGLTTDQFDSTIAKVDCFYKRGQIRQFYTQDLAGAAADFDAVVHLDPDNWAARSELAWVNYLQSGDLATAVATLTDLQQQNPTNKWAFWRLADVYKQAGQNTKAVEMYRATLVRDPQNQQLQTQIEDLQNR